MNVLGKNITDLARERQLSIPKLAMRAGVDKGNLSKMIKSGEGYSAKSLNKLADALSVTVVRLFAEDRSTPLLPEGVRKIPILDEESILRLPASAPYFQDAEMRDFVLTTNRRFSEGTFGFTIPDDSMLPDLNKGDTVIVDPEAELRPGRFVVAAIDNVRTLVRRYADRGKNDQGEHLFELVPSNAHFPTIRSDKHACVIRGVARQRSIDLD